MKPILNLLKTEPAPGEIWVRRGLNDSLGYKVVVKKVTHFNVLYQVVSNKRTNNVNKELFAKFFRLA